MIDAKRASGYTERDYQLGAMDQLRRGFTAGMRRQVLVAPTGSGKTVTAAGIVRRAVQKGSRVCFLAHRRELIEQCSEKLTENVIDHGVIMRGHWRHFPELPVQIASIQTLIRRLERLESNAPHLIIIDECHRSAASMYRTVLQACPRAAVIGLTATPERGDGAGLDDIYEGMVQTSTVQELIDRGYLVPPRVFTTSLPDLASVRSGRGDYDKGDLSAVMSKIDLVGDVISHWRKHAGERKTVVFAVDVARSMEVRDAFRSAGINAEHVDGKTSSRDRPEILERWRNGETQVVTNCEVLTEGFDMPMLAAVVLLRPTQSQALYLQMVGRGLRSWPGKTDCVILDHAGAAWSHGMPQESREWTLAGRKKRKGKENNETVCKGCLSSFFRNGKKACPYCGHELDVQQRQIIHVDGDLSEVSLEDVKRLRKKAQAKAKTLEELQSYGAKMGYKPGWATYVWAARSGRAGH